MNTRKKNALAAAGWACGDAEDFLELSAEERCLVELRLAVSHALHYRRKRSNLTQQDLAKRLGTSQSRVARMEAASSDVSLDLLFAGLFALGGNMKDLARATVKAKPPARGGAFYEMAAAYRKPSKIGSRGGTAHTGKLVPKK